MHNTDPLIHNTHPNGIQTSQQELEGICHRFSSIKNIFSEIKCCVFRLITNAMLHISLLQFYIGLSNPGSKTYIFQMFLRDCLASLKDSFV